MSSRFFAGGAIEEKFRFAPLPKYAKMISQKHNQGGYGLLKNIFRLLVSSLAIMVLLSGSPPLESTNPVDSQSASEADIDYDDMPATEAPMEAPTPKLSVTAVATPMARPPAPSPDPIEPATGPDLMPFGLRITDETITPIGDIVVGNGGRFVGYGDCVFFCRDGRHARRSAGR